jgi:L-seryl-tRNA(Ser) seleniumtransferase
VDKITVAAVQALLRIYLFGATPELDIPVLRQSTEALETLTQRARKITGALSGVTSGDIEIEIVEDVAAVGGGSFACEDVASIAVALKCPTESKATGLARKMRKQPMPVLSRIKGSEVRLNLRSVMPYEDDDLVAALKTVLG